MEGSRYVAFRSRVGKRLGNYLNVTVYEIGNGFTGVAAYPWPRVTKAPHRAQPVTVDRANRAANGTLAPLPATVKYLIGGMFKIWEYIIYSVNLKAFNAA